MQQFEWQGRHYNFDATACYHGNGMIKLPNGDILVVEEWFESAPPEPKVIKLLSDGPNGCTIATVV